jgi:Rab family protein
MGESSPLKLVLLGESGVGKTSLVAQYLSGQVPESVNPTVGAAFMTKYVIADGQQFELLIWDTAGQEVYRGLAPMYYRSALIAIIVFDVTNDATYNSVNYWIRELRANSDESIVIVVCANKIDLEDKRIVDSVTASESASEKGALYAEASAITGAGVEKVFEIAVAELVRQRAAGHVKKGKTKVELEHRRDPANGDEKGCC